MLFFNKKRKKLDIDIKAKAITVYEQISTLELLEIVEVECRKKNIQNPLTRELVKDKIVLTLDAGWTFTSRTFRAYHKKNKKRYTKHVEIHNKTITEVFFSREDYKRKK